MTSRVNALKPQLVVEVALRVALWSLFLHMEEWTPFERKIHQEEMWLYKNPRMPSYVPSELMWTLVSIIPLAIFSVTFLVRRDNADLLDSLLAYTLSLGLNGIITDTIKLTVGRPRPDFFYRCFPDGTQYPGMKCTGDLATINEGRKSFPSGHSSFCFTAMWFIFLYLSAKFRVFSSDARLRFVGLRFTAVLLPPMVALLVAISRTCDYHHHWQDVTIGSIIGILTSWICYRQYYPALSDNLASYPRSSSPSVLPLSRDSSMAKFLPVDGEKDYKFV